MNTKNTQAKLSELADIRSGHPFRSKVKHTPDNWDFYVLQLKDVQKDAQIDLSKVAQVRMPGDSPQTLRASNILLRARGGNYYSSQFNSYAPNAIASGQFFVLSPKTDIVDPHYLSWYLNQPTAQQYLQRNDTGSNIPMINKRTISELLVTLPSLKTQHKIANVYAHWLKEKKLTEQLLDNREKITRGMCQQFINQDFKNRDAS